MKKKKLLMNFHWTKKIVWLLELVFHLLGLFMYWIIMQLIIWNSECLKSKIHFNQNFSLLNFEIRFSFQYYLPWIKIFSFGAKNFLPWINMKEWRFLLIIMFIITWTIKLFIGKRFQPSSSCCFSSILSIQSYPDFFLLLQAFHDYHHQLGNKKGEREREGIIAELIAMKHPENWWVLNITMKKERELFSSFV